MRRLGRALPLALAALLAPGPPTAGDLWDQQGREAAPAAPPAPAPAPRQEAPPARLRFGATGPLTGPDAGRGAILRVTQALLARGGAAELVIEDDGGIPVRTVPAARHLEDYWRVAAFLSPLGEGPISALMPYLRATRTPTLFLPSAVTGRAGPRIIPLPPNGRSLTRALATEAERRRLERQQAGLLVAPGALAIVADTEDGRDRLEGARAAGLSDLRVVMVPPDTGPVAPERAGGHAGIVLAIGPPRVALAAADLAAALARLCGTSGEQVICFEPPVLALSLTEPFDWAELASGGLAGALTADWLPVDPAALAAHGRALAAAGIAERPSRLTLWGHALAELADAVARRAGPAATPDQALAAARALGMWNGTVLAGLRLDAPWPVSRARLVTIERGGPRAEAGWLDLR
jgi:hypothetical protein